jgi:hypothetical protein
MLTLAGMVIPFTEMSLNTSRNTLTGYKKKIFNHKTRCRCPACFFDMTADGSVRPVGRIVMGLRADIVPRRTSVLCAQRRDSATRAPPSTGSSPTSGARVVTSPTTTEPRRQIHLRNQVRGGELPASMANVGPNTTAPSSSSARPRPSVWKASTSSSVRSSRAWRSSRRSSRMIPRAARPPRRSLLLTAASVKIQRERKGEELQYCRSIRRRGRDGEEPGGHKEISSILADPWRPRI